MGRFSRERRVFFFEEPLWREGAPALQQTSCPQTGVRVVTPLLRPGLSHDQIADQQRRLLSQLLVDEKLTSYIAWYYTPMAMEFTSVLNPVLTVYDCMDELSGFANAPSSLVRNEAALFQQADLVFTGGASLFESKRRQHSAVHKFPSSVDTEHFKKALSVKQEPRDQAAIPHPRLGYAGVIDERMDLQLLADVASTKPEWQFVLLGPIVKVDPTAVPNLPNIHLLGMKPYAELPDYLAGWDIALLPFALNKATKYISPTKTPEYLAAGRRVISTAIKDVVSPYGDLGLVSIINDSAGFIRAAEEILTHPVTKDFRNQVEAFLSQSSWDRTAEQMEELMEESFKMKHQATVDKRSLSKSSLPEMSGETL